MKVPVKAENVDELVPKIRISGNGADVAIKEHQTLTIEPSGSRALREHKAKGPRTQLGKQTASRNSIKHGVFSKVVVLPGEPRAEYEQLWAGLREGYQPQGAPEELLVEKLSVLTWRLRRLLIAEAAEIRQGFRLANDGKGQQPPKIIVRFVEVGHEDHEDLSHLMQRTANRKVPERERCMGLLRDLQRGIKSRGFDPDRDSAILTKLYGRHTTNNQKECLFDRYRSLVSVANCREEERSKHGSCSPRQCVEIFLAELEDELKWLAGQESIESEECQLEKLCRSVPDGPQLDRLLRYEASLERAFDRTLSQLERLQRMRLGHPVPPPINLNVTSSRE